MPCATSRTIDMACVRVMTTMKMMILNLVMFLLFSINLDASEAVLAVSQSQAKPGCEQQERCGNLLIPYPFGISKECSLNSNFTIYCNESINPPQPFLYNQSTNIIVTDISTVDGELQILMYLARDCSTQQPQLSQNVTLEVPMFNVSNTKNKFTVVGCNNYAFIYGSLNGEKNGYKSGCMSLCSSFDEIAETSEGSCSGNGCCQIEIPRGLRDLEIDLRNFNDSTQKVSFNPCGYAFVAEETSFNFSRTYITNFSEERFPMVLDWAIKDETCLTAENKTRCICGENSEKIVYGSEYRCKCFEGYEGNPYLLYGCQDIDECKDGNLHKCKYECHNTPGNYTCPCQKGYLGDARIGGDGCTPKSNFILSMALGIGGGLMALLIGIVWVYLGYKRWKFIQMRNKFFEQNGGLMLQQHLSSLQGSSSNSNMAKIYSHQHLQKATNNFDETAIAGKGGYGTVYKGVLENGQIVAIKKSKLVDKSQIQQFINEVIILSQINHRNVVRLLGCCLETKVPLLVYEFISNGTLFDHIHNRQPLPWPTRLKLASETASVLSYLHSSASTPIIHRDIKPTNILLDENFTAKVSDFGASKLVPMDQTQLSTMVQGTLGYLDPEYLLTSELTEKSDVYSFGIVLVELITGKKAISFDGPETERNLASYFLSSMKEDHLEAIVEKDMVHGANYLNSVKEVAKLAKMCLGIQGEGRPTMKEVAAELEGLRTILVENVSIRRNSECGGETVNLLDSGAVESDLFALTHTPITVDDSMKAQVKHQMGHGR